MPAHSILFTQADFASILKYSNRQGDSDLAKSTTFSTAEAARQLGISRQTLHRWFAQGRVADVRRDRNNWRVFTLQDIRRIRDEVDRGQANVASA